jgi:DNA-directed RNA polymerase subunit RPC12/RpoP
MAITLTCTGCGKSYQLKDEMAGRKVRCPGCQSVQMVPEASTEDYQPISPPGEGGTEGTLNPAFNHDKFLLRQKLMTIGSKYVVWDERQQPILFIERPAYFLRSLLAAFAAAICFLVTVILSIVVALGIGQMLHQDVVGVILAVVFLIASIVLTFAVGFALSPKRHIDFYADESRSDLLLKILQDKKFHAIVATYTVLTPAGELLGRMRKNYLYNVFRKKWDVFGAGGEKIAVAREDSLILSLLRRFLGPFFGILRTNFVILTPGENGQERVRGEFNRKFTVFDRYVLDVSRDRPRVIDRRLAVALGVLLDTGEHR